MRRTTDSSSTFLRTQTSAPLRVPRYPMGCAADTTQFSPSKRSRRVAVGQSRSASQGHSPSWGRMARYQNFSRSFRS